MLRFADCTGVDYKISSVSHFTDKSVIRMHKTIPVFLLMCCLSCSDQPPKLDRLTYASEFSAVLVSKDGKCLFTSHPNGDVRIWHLSNNLRDTDSKDIPQDIRRQSGRTAIALSPDGRTLALGGPDNKIRLWEVTTNQEPTLLGLHSKEVKAVAFTRDGNSLLSAGLDQVVKVWNLETKTYKDLPHGHSKGVLVLVVSPDGKTFATATEDEIKI